MYICILHVCVIANQKNKRDHEFEIDQKRGVWKGSAGGKEGGHDVSILQTQNKRQKSK